MPTLHVICAGSLLEFTINDQDFSFPVGRVQFMYLKPLSFLEFLYAHNYQKIIDYINSISISDSIDEAVHNHILELIKEYFLVGGMPSIVQDYINARSFLNCKRMQEALLIAYENDFGKYSSKTEYKYLQILFRKAPEIVGKHVKFSKIDDSVKNPSRQFKQALIQLSHAGLIQQIFATSANGLPLRAEINQKKFKLIFLDIGLYERSMGIDPKKIYELSLLQINKGSLTEQFVGQELLAYVDPYENKKLYFWRRGKLGSEAEVDYLHVFNSEIIPIEVKAGKTGRLRSLHKFLEEKKISTGIRISEKPLSLNKNVLNVPFYLISQLSRLLEELH